MIVCDCVRLGVFCFELLLSYCYSNKKQVAVCNEFECAEF